MTCVERELHEFYEGFIFHSYHSKAMIGWIGYIVVVSRC